MAGRDSVTNVRVQDSVANVVGCVDSVAKILLRVYFGRTYVCKRKYLTKFLRYFQINISSINGRTARMPKNEHNLFLEMFSL